MRRTLSSLTSGLPIDHGALSEVVRDWTWHSFRHRPCSKVRNQLRAVEVLRQATHDDLLTALVSLLAEARRVRGVDACELARIVADELDDQRS